jgi:hypothetical protein
MATAKFLRALLVACSGAAAHSTSSRGSATGPVRACMIEALARKTCRTPDPFGLPDTRGTGSNLAADTLGRQGREPVPGRPQLWYQDGHRSHRLASSSAAPVVKQCDHPVVKSPHHPQHNDLGSR